MNNLTLGWVLSAGLALLALHMVSAALAKALRTYSRSRLEEVCAARGRPERAETIARWDERTERAVDGLGVLTGLGLAALLGASTVRFSNQVRAEAVVSIALVLGALGHVAAGVLGRVHAEGLLDRLWPVAEVLRKMMTPFTTTARGVEALAYRRSRRSAGTPRPQSVEVEIHTAPDEPDQSLEFGLPDSAREMIERVVEMTRQTVAEVMTERSSMLTLPASVSALDAARAFTESGRSRVPLFGENRDDIVGVLYAKDLFPRLVDADPDTVIPRKLARPPLFVPETKVAHDLLAEFRARRVQLAVVLDEYGGVSGLVTLEDLLEELVGLIDDEHDVPSDDEPVVALGDARFEVDAAMPLEDLNDRLDLTLPTDGDFETVGGLAFDALGHLPEPGASFRFEGVEFTVLEVADRSIKRLRLDLQPAEAVGGAAE